ncbi:MAG: hypothetical protein ACMXYL_02335 [Candidatus Woesearchaeota archaeon]
MMKNSRVAIILMIGLLSVMLLPGSMAICAQELTFEYTNNEQINHRMSFWILEQSDDNINITFLMEPMEVRPGETKNFTIKASSPESLVDEWVSFQVRKNAITVEQINLSLYACDNNNDIVYYNGVNGERILVVLGIIFIVVVGGFLVLAFDKQPRKKKVRETSQEKNSGIVRKKIDVDSLVEGYDIKPKEDTRLSSILIILMIIFIVLVFALILLILLTQNPTPMNTLPVAGI